MGAIQHVAVVIPVRDEEQLLPRCLAALSIAVDAVPPSVATTIMLVLDACADRSREITAAWPFRTMTIAAQNVGRARAAGIDAVLADTRVALESIWIANTDADSAVPESWLTHQLEIADDGASLVLGAIRPDGRGASVRQTRRWNETHPSGVSHDGDVYGANLGIRASTYRAAGGFEPVPEHEDVRLVTRAHHLGVPIIATIDHPVLTSARTEGRTPGGYAGFLRADLLRI